MEQLKEENEKLSAGLMELKNVQTKLMEEVETARAEKASLTKQQVSVEREDPSTVVFIPPHLSDASFLFSLLSLDPPLPDGEHARSNEIEPDATETTRKSPFVSQEVEDGFRDQDWRALSVESQSFRP